jgi:hypothetical protein
MIVKFFEWVASLPPQKAWGLFVLVCTIMAFVPYARISFLYLRILFGNQKPGIIDFSWRLAQDHFIFSLKGKRYYLNASRQNFILEGGKLILNWTVQGAYRVDVLPIGTKMKGNTAVISASKSNRKFTLIAYTTKGKLTKEISIEASLFRHLSTLNLSRENKFNQAGQQLNTTSFSSSSVMMGKYKQGQLKKLPFILTDGLKSKTKRINYNRQIDSMHLWFDRKLFITAQNRFNKKNNYQRVAFRPNRFNASLELNKNENLIS